jgi:hypothetical protein
MKFRKIEETNMSNNFVKLKDKESVVGVFAGDIHEITGDWIEQKFIESPGGKSFRFRINLIVKEGSTFVPKIFEQGVTVYRQLEELHAEYDLSTIFVKITRNGISTDTAYSVLPSKAQLKKEELEHIKTLKLHDLSSKKETTQQTPPWDREEVSF